VAEDLWWLQNLMKQMKYLMTEDQWIEQEKMKQVIQKKLVTDDQWLQ
jgi:hypothetical protein